MDQRLVDVEEGILDEGVRACRQHFHAAKGCLAAGQLVVARQQAGDAALVIGETVAPVEQVNQLGAPGIEMRLIERRRIAAAGVVRVERDFCPLGQRNLRRVVEAAGVVEDGRPYRQLQVFRQVVKVAV